MTKYAPKIVSLLAIAVIALVVTGALYTWEYGDDFLNIVKMRNFSIFGYIWHLYEKWDGRVLSPAGVVLMLFLKIGSAPIAVVSYLIVYALSVVLVWKTLQLWWKVSAFEGGIVIGFYALFLIGTWPLYKDVVYWLTGGYYSVFLLQGVLVFWLYSKQALSLTPNYKFRPVQALLIALLSLNTQNLLLPLALLMGIHTLYILFGVNRRLGYALILQHLFPVFVGLLVVSIAPGNFARIHSESTSLETTVGFSAIAVLKMLFRFAIYAKWAAIAGFVLGFSFIQWPEHWNFRKVAFIFIIGVAMAVVSLAPFFLTPFLARIRVYYFGTLFIMIGIIPLGVFVRHWLATIAPIVYNVRYLPAVLFLLYGGVFFTNQLRKMIPFSKQVAVRDQFLESKRGSGEVVHYQRLELPQGFFLIRWADIKRYGNWGQTKEYYDLGGYVEDEPNK